MITTKIENRRMISFTGEIAYLDTYEKWSLWYDDTTGQLDYLLFESEELAKNFKDYFDNRAKSLKNDDEKWQFYEKTKLKDFVDEWKAQLQNET